MRVEVYVSGVEVEKLAKLRLKEAGLNVDNFKMLYNHAAHTGSRGDGNVSRIKYTYEGRN